MGNTSCFNSKKAGQGTNDLQVEGSRRTSSARNSRKLESKMDNVKGSIDTMGRNSVVGDPGERQSEFQPNGQDFDPNHRQKSATIAVNKNMMKTASKNLDQDDDDDKGSILNALDNVSAGSGMSGNGSIEEEQVEKVDPMFGMGGDKAELARVKKNFEIARSRVNNFLKQSDYSLNPSKRRNEGPLDDMTPNSYQKALFYMYGGCESMVDNQYMVHGQLRKNGIWDGGLAEVEKYLTKQIVVPLEDDDEEDLTQVDNIIKFLQKHSKYGKNVREVEEFGSTLSSNLYKVTSSEDEIVIKIPKKVENQDEVAFLDIIYQTQLMQFLKDNRTDGMKQFFPNVHEEIFIVNKNTHTILNYITFVDFSQISLINMLDGPTAGAIDDEFVDEEGYRSQEIFTPEKYMYLYYKGLLLLEFLYDNGMTHGHINSNSLRISDDFTFTLSDFPISIVTKGFAQMSVADQATTQVQVRGFNKTTASQKLRSKMTNLQLSLRPGGFEEQKHSASAQEDFGREFNISELIQEDWRDMASTFYFPRLFKSLKDDRMRKFLDDTNRELLEEGQESSQIKNICQKAHRFIMSNIWILEELIEQLSEEQMFDAVQSIGQEIFDLGVRMDNVRLQAFAQLTLGEIASKEHLEEPEKAEAGIKALIQANELYQQDAQILDSEEYSRLCIALSTLYRTYKKDSSQAKRWLELAKDKITDKRVLLTFYTETANILSSENKHYQALDSNKKAMELARQIYRDDDYAMFELQMALAEGYEKCDEKEQAEITFNECFAMLDGRDGQSVYSRGMSIRSKLSKALSIKSKGTSIVAYGQRRSTKLGRQSDQLNNDKKEKAGAMQRIAVQLRQKQEYGRAEKLMLKAIAVKKQLLGSEISEDIVYLYGELAVTYQVNEDLENAVKCVKKQLLIWDSLHDQQTMEYAQTQIFLGELYRDQECPNLAIDMLDAGIKLHEKMCEQPLTQSQFANQSRVEEMNDPQVVERTEVMKTLAEEYIKTGQVVKGIKTVEGALMLQMNFYSNMVNYQVQETMLLLAEAYTINQQPTEALNTYKKIVEARTEGFGSSDEPVKDIYRKMAPLWTQLTNYLEAAECLTKVIADEQQDIIKVGLYTKIAGNYKKADKQDECIKASKDAYELIKRLSGDKDSQTCRCLINLAQVYQYFELNDEAKVLYQQFITAFEAQNGENDTDDWSSQPAFTKLNDFAVAAIQEMEGGGEEEYYDEEGDGDEE